MTDKEKKNKIADIILDFYDEYHSNEINRPMIPSIYAGKILDSMQEEPVSEDLEKAAWLYYDKNRLPIPPDWDLHKEFIDFFKAGVRWKEQNDSNLSKVLERDNLDEMAEEYSSCTYLEEVLGEGDREVLKTRLKNTFKAGANWQKERIIIKVCKWFNDNACNYFGHMPVYSFIDDLRKAMED